MTGVDAGLAADRGIDLSQQSRRHLDEVDAAQQHGRREAGEVADHAAAQRHQRRLAVGTTIEQFVHQPAEAREVLAALAGRDRHRLGLHARLLERGGEACAIDRLDRIVAHDRDARGSQQRAGEFTRAIDQAGADGDVVGATGQVDADGAGRTHAVCPAVWACRCARMASITCSVVRSAGWAVGIDHDVGLGVDRIALLHEPRENFSRIALAQQRPVGALLHPVEQHVEFGAQPHGERPGLHQPPRLRVHVGAAAGRQDARRLLQQPGDHPPFAGAELLLTKAFEEFGDGTARRALDLVVCVDEREAESLPPAVCRWRSCPRPSGPRGLRCAARTGEKRRPCRAVPVMSPIIPRVSSDWLRHPGRRRLGNCRSGGGQVGCPCRAPVPFQKPLQRAQPPPWAHHCRRRGGPAGRRPGGARGGGAAPAAQALRSPGSE